jgi:hypothetical protein
MKPKSNIEAAETVQTGGSQAVAQERLISLAPIQRPFVQYLGADGYEPNGLRAKDAQGVEYCAVSGGIWNENLVSRPPGELWQAGRRLTDDDIAQISWANADAMARRRSDG